MLPSTSELERIRSDLENSLLPDTCNILTVTRTSDGQGGFTEAWGTATASTNVACRLDGINATEVVAGAGLQAFHTYVLTLPHDTTITTADRVEVGDDTFNITSVDQTKSWSACVRAWLERL